MNIKRIFALCIALVILVTLSSCASTKADNGKLNVVATNFALYDFARAVCGDSCNVTMLISPGSESHDFEATLTDMALIEQADVFIYIGGESEDWVDGIFASMGSSAEKIEKIRAMDLVKTYQEEESATANHGDHEHGTADEHVWTSLTNAIVITEKIAATVVQLDGSLADSVNQRLDEYSTELTALHDQFRDTVAKASRNEIIVADRFPFRYMAEEYGLEYCSAFSGCSSDTEPTLSTVNLLVEKVKDGSVPVIFIIEFSDGATASSVAAETGAEIMTLHSAHNVTRADFDSGITYADIMRQNLEALKIALN